MTDSDRQPLAAYVGTMQVAMRLADWSIRIDDEPADSDAHAAIQCTYGRKVATLYIGKAFWESDANERRHTIAHELLHIHLWGIYGVASRKLRKLLGSLVYKMLDESLRERVEFAVDGIADAIAPLLPAYPEAVTNG